MALWAIISSYFSAAKPESQEAVPLQQQEVRQPQQEQGSRSGTDVRQRQPRYFAIRLVLIFVHWAACLPAVKQTLRCDLIVVV